MIAQRSIEEVLDVADIVQVIGRSVELKKSGANFKGLSPFTAEKTPSFMVSPAKGIFKCFSSGHGGNVITFLQLNEGLTFPEAVKRLAEDYSINLIFEGKEISPEKQDELKRLELCVQASYKSFVQSFDNLTDDHKAKIEVERRGWSQETLDAWGIGYAPEGWRFLAPKIRESGYWPEGEMLGLVKHSNANYYDIYRDRLIFPIHDRSGKVIGFGGRYLGSEKDAPKYINSSESPLYDKSRVLYGLNFARKAIAKEGFAIITEGYADVISLHQACLENTVATCGTSLTYSHVKILRRYAKNVLLMFDGDSAGLKAAMRAIPEIIKGGLHGDVLILQDGIDPDDLARKYQGEELTSYIVENKVDLIEWYASNVLDNTESVADHGEAFRLISEMLAGIDNEITRDQYTKLIAKKTKVKVSALNKMVKTAVDRSVQENSKNNQAVALPKDEQEHFMQWGFVERKNQYLFPIQGGALQPMSNFIIEPLFHIYSKTDNKRLVRVRNTNHNESVIDVSSKALVQPAQFQEVLFDEGNYLFEGSKQHFYRILRKLGENFPVANEIKTLGWQPEGFYAFANGIYNGAWKVIDQYGVVLHEETKYFLPAFSTIYKNSRGEDDLYENDRNFKYKTEAGVGFEEWASQMVKVFDDNGKYAVAHLMSCVFRDIIYDLFKFFPHLYLFGEKGSGKSFLAWRLNNLFWDGMTGFNLTAGTNVGFYRRLARARNSVVWFDEYADSIDQRRIQALKSAYDGIGHEKGVMSRDNRTETTKVNSGLVISSQYLPTADDNALFTRSILCMFQQRGEENPYTQEEQREAQVLSRWEKGGLSRVITEILEHREVMQNEYAEVQHDIMGKMKADIHEAYEERILNNYVVELAVVKVMSKRIKLPFSYEGFYADVKRKIIEQSKMITESEGLSTFWYILENLVDSGRLIKDEDYEVQHTSSVTVNAGSETREIQLGKLRKVLYFRFQKVHGMYLELHRKQYNETGITRASIQHYLKTSPAFIGTKNSHRFSRGGVTSCYVMNQDKLPISLEREEITQPTKTDDYTSRLQGNDDDDVPF